jgi:periplasmic protein TonB
MDTNMVLNPSFNELVFENRHKNYGAYQIRKRYSRNVVLAGFLAVSIFTMAIGAYFINMPESQAGVPPVITDNRVDTIPMIIGDHPPKPRVQPPANPPAPKGSTNTITSNIVVAKDSVTPVNPNDTIGRPDGKIGGIGKLKDSIPLAAGNPCINCDSVPKKKEPRKWLPFPPKDPGLDAFFVKNIRYPQIAKEQGIEGVVYLTFIVDTKGDVRDIAILKGAHPLLDKEVLRVAKFMPKWEPVKDENGEIVEYQYSKPVRFKLAK